MKNKKVVPMTPLKFNVPTFKIVLLNESKSDKKNKLNNLYSEIRLITTKSKKAKMILQFIFFKKNNNKKKKKKK